MRFLRWVVAKPASARHESERQVDMSMNPNSTRHPRLATSSVHLFPVLNEVSKTKCS